MVIDTSAVLAILQNEPERRRFAEAIEAADSRRMSAATWVESSIVIEARYGSDGLRDFDRLMERIAVEIAPVDLEQARAAREAFRRFGKGRHAAGLNFGDCLAYALARTLGEPLLFKGTDFSQTDLVMGSQIS